MLRAKTGNSLTGTLKFHPKGHAFFFPDMPPTRPTSPPASIWWRSTASTSRAAIPAPPSMATACSLPSRNPARNARSAPAAKSCPTPRTNRAARSKKSSAAAPGRLVGIFRKKGDFGWIDCEDKAIDGRIELIGDTTAQPGQMVVVDLENWNDPNITPRGRIIEVLGWPGDPGVDIIGVIHRFGLRTSFPDDVLAAARAVPEEPEPAEIARREDWRDKLVITIDPADAKDHDDAIWLEKTRNGWTLAVHIADVSHYIKPRQPDGQGSRRTRQLDLSRGPRAADAAGGTEQWHLLAQAGCGPPDQVRVVGNFRRGQNHQGHLHRCRHPQPRQAFLRTGAGDPRWQTRARRTPIRSSSRWCSEGWKLASTLRRRRFANGALDLEMPEIKIRLDDKGRACAAEPVIHTESHQLVEECMLAANEAVARKSCANA